MRIAIYGTLAVLVTLLLLDTNIGKPAASHKRALIDNAIARLDHSGLSEDARLRKLIAATNGFRESRVYGFLVNFSSSRDMDFSYYAFTPVFSQSKVFIGSSFWDTGNIGRSSVLVHEFAHIRRHKRLFLGGVFRGDDEAEAYERQYLTYRDVGLSPEGSDGTVYWDMMIGVQTYLLPRKPAYAKRKDIQQAIRILKEAD